MLLSYLPRGMSFSLAVLAGFIFFTSCDSSNSVEVVQESVAPVKKFEIDTALYFHLVKMKTSELGDSSKHDLHGVNVYFNRAIDQLYSFNDYLPLWQNKEMYLDFFEELREARYDGLLTEDYNLELIDSLARKLVAKEELDHDLLSDLDIIVTNSFLLYSLHLGEGKATPKLLDSNWNYPFLGVDKSTIDTIYSYLKSQKIASYFNNIRSRNEMYMRMREQLKDHLALKAAGGWETIIFEEGVKIEEGDSSELIPAIRRRLFGAIPGTDVSQLQSTLYDTTLLSEVKGFQLGHGLADDGVIGKGTLNAMNISIDEKIDLIRVNMERVRWLSNQKVKRDLIVNIAGFEAYYLVDNQLRHTSKVMVGKYFTQTPVFEADLQYVEFNPTWTVPRSIIVNETLPRMRKDPNYLSDRNMSLLNYQGKVVATSDVDLSPGASFPYMVRQGPGPGNALGRVKFIFPNAHSVYLHDTPSKYLFTKTERAFSHGCVRAENPLEWAEVLLASNGIDQGKINTILEKGETKRVFPKEPIKVRIMYLTFIASDAGMPVFYQDIYKRDSRILNVLNSPVSDEVVNYQKAEIDAALALSGR